MNDLTDYALVLLLVALAMIAALAPFLVNTAKHLLD